MNAMVTGGAGFIGSNLVRCLAQDGHRVTVLDDLSSGHLSNLRGLALRFIEGDVCDQNAVEDAIEAVEVVFHLAASVGNKRSIDGPVRDAEVNVIGTVRLLEAARRRGVRKFVLSSSAGIFGELKSVPIRENHPVDPDTPYGASKLCAEKETLAYGRLYGMETVCLRYFNVYGPNQRFDAYGNVIPIFVFQMLRGEKLTIFGDGEQTRDFVNVLDVVQANLRAAATPGARGAFNIGSGSRVTINDLVRQLKTCGALEPEVSYALPRPGDVRDSLADISAARRTFGFAPSVPLHQGLSEYVAWARQEVGCHAG
ncbi:NAD-dependent epimerase/dehydratase [Candidatus Sulfopaludibacter sp. SbA3]|nr:NAD-dependent epimerase/dehydratase [Candidatus Sulfopaludibacter sp. SbA3]